MGCPAARLPPKFTQRLSLPREATHGDSSPCRHPNPKVGTPARGAVPVTPVCIHRQRPAEPPRDASTEPWIPLQPHLPPTGCRPQGLRSQPLLLVPSAPQAAPSPIPIPFAPSPQPISASHRAPAHAAGTSPIPQPPTHTLHPMSASQTHSPYSSFPSHNPCLEPPAPHTLSPNPTSPTPG